jgi:hypothetical protein
MAPSDQSGMARVTSGPQPPRTPKWKREASILRRDGLFGYLRGAWLLHRFHRSVRRMERAASDEDVS